AWRGAAVLFGSGFCALVYQIGWLREFRLIFGASTAASAAVLAIFIGGLGVGGLLLGRRADHHPRPILLYAQLEAIVAVSAALTPLLLAVVRALYIAPGPHRRDDRAAAVFGCRTRGPYNRDGRHSAGCCSGRDAADRSAPPRCGGPVRAQHDGRRHGLPGCNVLLARAVRYASLALAG